MITFSHEKIVDHVDEVEQLARLHYKESCPYDDIPININWIKIEVLEKNGLLKFYTMKEDDRLIGYAAFNLFNPLEYFKSPQASLSNIFIHPDKRGRGASFISWCDEQLKKLGVQVVYHHVKSKNDYGLLLKRLGYDIMNIEYSKRLDK